MIGVSYMYVKPYALKVNELGFCAAHCGTDHLFKCEYPCGDYEEYLNLVRCKTDNVGD